ncbi:hypothetical protein ACLOJK_017694 [Asimina triloba]
MAGKASTNLKTIPNVELLNITHFKCVCDCSKADKFMKLVALNPNLGPWTFLLGGCVANHAWPANEGEVDPPSHFKLQQKLVPAFQDYSPSQTLSLSNNVQENHSRHPINSPRLKSSSFRLRRDVSFKTIQHQTGKPWSVLIENGHPDATGLVLANLGLSFEQSTKMLVLVKSLNWINAYMD